MSVRDEKRRTPLQFDIDQPWIKSASFIFFFLSIAGSAWAVVIFNKDALRLCFNALYKGSRGIMASGNLQVFYLNDFSITGRALRFCSLKISEI